MGKLENEKNIFLLKTIDKYLIKQFIGPFIATFFIAIFVLLMQFIWVYVDDMVGKGAGFALIIEIIFYNSISLIPWALPIAILISSVMVMGNLGERYELASLNSAGVSLIRVMLPMFYFSIMVAIFSFFCSNHLVPVTNLKFKSRLHDVRKQKATLNLEEDVFNDDFSGFTIHIGEKDEDNRTIRDVIIYDQKENKNGKLSMITAETGEMYMTEDDRYFVMNLKNGIHYQEGENTKGKKDKHSFIRTNFKEWTKIFDTKEFDINLTDMDRFENHYTMLSVRQLYNAIDSIDKRMGSYGTRLDEYVQKSFYPLKQKLMEIKKVERAKRLAEQKKKKKTVFKKEEKTLKKDTTKPRQKPKSKPKKKKNNKNTKKKKTIKSKKFSPSEVRKAKAERDKVTQKKKEKAKKRKEAAAVRTKSKAKSEVRKKKTLEQHITKDLKEYSTFYETISIGDIEKNSLSERAKTTARGIQNQAQATQRSVNPKRESRVKHVFVLYSKFTFALVCCVFLFIGAPMGALVRKGGFGYPILIAILFFMFFIILNILFQKLAESYVLPAELAVWCPIMILVPLGFVLTRRAMSDKKIIDLSRYFGWVRTIFEKFKKKEVILK